MAGRIYTHDLKYLPNEMYNERRCFNAQREAANDCVTSIILLWEEMKMEINMKRTSKESVTADKLNMKIWIFSLAIISSVVLLLAVSYFSKSPVRLLVFENDGLFFEDCMEGLADWNAADYTLENSIYHTPFVCIIYHLFSAFCGEEIQTALELSQSRQTMTFLLIFFGCILFAFFKVLDGKLSQLQSAERIILPIALMFTGPFLYWVSKGNLIFISLVCCYFYLIGYDNDNRVIRMVSYLLLAIAAGISFYPIIFVVLSAEKRKKETVVPAVTSILFWGLPYIKYGGHEFTASIKAVLFGVELPQYEGKANYSFLSIMNSISDVLWKRDVNKIVIFLLGMAVCTLIFIMGREKWQRIFACSLFLIMFSQPCPYHNLLFMYLPLLFFLEDERQNGDGIYLFGFIIIFIPYFAAGSSLNYSNILYGCNLFSILGMVLISLAVIGGKYAFKIIQR